MLTRNRLIAAVNRTFGPHKRLYSATSTSPTTFMDLYSRATDEFRQGNLVLAVDFNKRALEEAARSNNSNWRDVAAVRLNQAHLLKLQSDFVGAREEAEKALASLDSHFSGNKLEVCHALDVLAELNCELGDYDRAADQISRAIDVKSRVSGFTHPNLAKSYNIKGAIMLNQGHVAQARSDFIRALAINVRAFGRVSPLPLAVGITLSNIAGVLRKEENRLSECIATYREVLVSFESAMSKSDSSWMVGSALTDLAECLIETKDAKCIEEAKSLLARSLHIFLCTRSIDHPSTERASALLKVCGSAESIGSHFTEETAFVETLLNECEQVLPKQDGKVSGDIIFLDRRGHVGQGHPHTPLIY